FTLGGSARGGSNFGAGGLAPAPRGGGPTAGRFGVTGDTRGTVFGTGGAALGRGGAGASISTSSNGSSSSSTSAALASSLTVGSSSAIGATSSTLTSSRNEGPSAASRRTSPNSALVVSKPSKTSEDALGSSPSTRLVDSMSSDASGSTAAGSINPSTGAGSSSGSGSGSATGGGFGGGAVRAVGAPLGRGGSSTSRNTRLEVLRLPNLAGSSPDSGLAGAAAVPTDRRSGSPYIRR